MKVSVVIPCYNGEPFLSTQLEALARQEYGGEWEIVFADNGSTDGSADLARSYASRIPIRVVDASLRQGQPFALNTGIRASTGEIVLLTDADDEVGERWLPAMARALESHDLVACRMDGSRHNPPESSRTPQQSGVQGLWYPPWCSHAGGGTLGMKRSVFDAVGDFAEDLPYLHDTDFCIRAYQAGIALEFVPDAVLHLRQRSNWTAIYRQSANWAEYNGILARRYWQPDASRARYWNGFLKDWVRLASQLRRVNRKQGRDRIAWMLGRQVGRVRGVVMRGGIPV